MKTEVLMKRELFGCQVLQQSKTGFFSATDIVAAGNKWRVENNLPFFNLQEWLRNKSTQEFIKELEEKFGEVKKATKGRNAATWVHPLLFIDMALAISPKLKLEVYGWLFDELIKNRNNSGDSYKEMCGYLFAHSDNKRDFSANIKRLAFLVKQKCNVEDWQSATEQQLAKRDKIHRDIGRLANVLNSNSEAIRLAFAMDNQC